MVHIKQYEYENKNIALTRAEFLTKIEQCVDTQSMSDGFATICQYVGASCYLTANLDGSGDFILCSDWPYDIARDLGAWIVQDKMLKGQLDCDQSALNPCFISIPDDRKFAKNFSRRICILPFTCGEREFAMLLLFSPEVSYSHERLCDAALACAYHIAAFMDGTVQAGLDIDLTEREMECLKWTSEGKTSDEIAVIIGISRNTVNNYITSVMNKTTTKSRAEAVAYAVRSHLI